MARDYERVSLRIYEDEIPDLFRRLRGMRVDDKSLYIRRLLLHDEFRRTYVGQVLHSQVPLSPPDLKGNRDMPGEGEKLLFDDEINL